MKCALSFPILLSAIPLYAVDYSRVRDEDRWPRVCWFSDGGISTNFPIHFFDSPFPQWPTFGIDLADKHPDYPAGLYMPDSNSSGTTVKWRRDDPNASSLDQLGGFLVSIIVASKDWADNMQCRLPGFRDRIAQVGLDKNDGGLNLDMTKDKIKRLCSYGTDAGKELSLRFTTGRPGCKLDWRNHRRVRLRSSLAAVEQWLHRLDTGCSQPQPGDPTYADLINDPKPPSYGWANDGQKAAAAQALEQFQATAASLPAAGSGHELYRLAPRPRPEIRTRPRI